MGGDAHRGGHDQAGPAGAARYALRRLSGLLHPPVIIYEPAAGSVSVLRDLPVAVRDGTVLGVNVVLPAGGGRFPVLSRRTGST